MDQEANVVGASGAPIVARIGYRQTTVYDIFRSTREWRYFVARERPKVGTKAGGSDELDLMEHLVKKSLAVNPALRGGMKTSEVLESLRQQVIAKADGGKEEQRKSRPHIGSFFEQKYKEFQGETADLLERERKLAEEKAGIQARYVEMIVGFLGMTAGGADTAEAREVLMTFREFLSDLGLTEAQIIERTRGNR